MKDFLLFRKMISPWLIQVLFWFAILIFVYTAIIDLLHKESYLLIFEVLILGPLITRVICELFIVFFRVNDNLVDIKQALIHKSETKTRQNPVD